MLFGNKTYILLQIISREDENGEAKEGEKENDVNVTTSTDQLNAIWCSTSDET